MERGTVSHMTTGTGTSKGTIIEGGTSGDNGKTEDHSSSRERYLHPNLAPLQKQRKTNPKMMCGEKQQKRLVCPCKTNNIVLELMFFILTF